MHLVLDGIEIDSTLMFKTDFAAPVYQEGDGETEDAAYISPIFSSPITTG